MPIISGGGGGAAFNGGTVHNPVTIDVGSLATAGGLEITGTGGSNVDRLDVDFLHTDFSLTGDGVLTLSSDDALGVTFQGTGGTLAQFDIFDDAGGRELNFVTHGGRDFQIKSNGTEMFRVSANTATDRGRVQRYPDNPATATLASGTGAQIDTNCDRETYTPVTFNPGVATTATCAVAVSPDNVTYTALWTETEPAGTAFDGTIHGIRVFVPSGWYLKLTVNAQATLGTTTYY